jgi:Nucleotide modification associated domain 2
MAVRVFSYIVRYDYGFAPNPFEGYCTVATCKPQIRRSAQVGDWIMGTGSADKSLTGRLVYAMQVDEVLTFDDYWKDARFTRKVPTDAGAVKRAYGDNIYHHRDDGEWLQADSRHSLADGKPNPGHVKVDTSVDAVLIGRRFSYFGGVGPAVPTTLRKDFGMDLVHSGQGHRYRFPQDLVNAAVAWFETLDTGVLGRPNDWA